MDSRKKTDQSKTITKLTQWGGVAIVLAAIGFAFQAGYFRSKQHAPSAKAVEPQSLFARVNAAVDSTQEKMGEIQRALEENERLRYENANLRLKLETVQFECHQKEAVAETKKIGTQIADEAGSRVARTLASIEYKPPGNLLPNQLYTLGVTYFKAHEDEKAAVILSYLTNFEENTVFQTARNYLMTGVAWYRVDNFDMAQLNFEKALKQPDTNENLQFQAQARMWQALVAKHFAKERETQYWLRDLVDHHPHSEEAEWVNGKEKREPATSHE